MEKIKEVIKEQLRVVDRELNCVYTNNACLNDELKKFMNASDKRIRSILSILYLHAFGVEITDDIFKVLTAGELIHNASLLHDDVIDDANERRGLLVIAKKYSPKISILLGDLLLSEAGKKLRSLNNEEITNSFLDCTKKNDRCRNKTIFTKRKNS